MFLSSLANDDIYIKIYNMEEKEDIHIDPIIEDEELLFYFSPQICKLSMDENSNAYRFIQKLITSMMKDYDANAKRIGFIGNVNTMIYSLVTMLDAYGEYMTTGFLSDFYPLHCQSRIWKSEGEQDPSDIEGE